MTIVLATTCAAAGAGDSLTVVNGSVPMDAFGDRIDWTNWLRVGLEFGARTAGCVVVDDVEVVAGRK